MPKRRPAAAYLNKRYADFRDSGPRRNTNFPNPSSSGTHDFHPEKQNFCLNPTPKKKKRRKRNARKTIPGLDESKTRAAYTPAPGPNCRAPHRAGIARCSRSHGRRHCLLRTEKTTVTAPRQTACARKRKRKEKECNKDISPAHSHLTLFHLSPHSHLSFRTSRRRTEESPPTSLGWKR